MKTIDCDILIVGSGAGGATLAQRFTKARRDVLMLEEGPHVKTAPPSVPEAFNTMWRCGGLTAGMGSPPVSYAEGRCVGGGTEINSAIMQRTPDDLLEAWREKYSIEHYGASVFAPYYDEAEKLIHASYTAGALGRASDLLKTGAEKLGWNVAPLKRAQKKCVGTNLCSAGCPTGAKQSMCTTAIPAALENGLRLISDCRVTTLLHKNGRVRGVEARLNNQKITIRANHIFLCAGAIHTPTLLLKSGIKHNIGKTLRMHPTIKVMAVFDEEVDAENSRLPLYAVTQFMPDIRLGGSVFMPGFFGMALAEDWQQRSDLWNSRKNIGLYYAMVRGQGCGTITPLPTAEPLVRYKLTDDDWVHAQRGLGYLAQTMFAAGARRVLPSISGHKGWTHSDEAQHFLRNPLPRAQCAMMSVHLFSSCPIGENKILTAADSHGKIHDFSNLFVADASIIPEAPGVNPQLTIMAGALRVADAFLDKAP